MSAQKDSQYKVIIAIKCVKELNHVRVPMVRCQISLQDKQKTSSLPFSEGQFFDLKELDISKPISLTFTLEKTNKEIGSLFVHIPQDVLHTEEVELADDFAFDYADKEFEGLFRGSYYIIILNKRNFIQRDETKKKTVQFDSAEKEDLGTQSPKPQLKTQGSLRSPLKKQSTVVISKEEEAKRQTNAKRIQEKVESTVNNAIKELKQSKEINDLDNSAMNSSSRDLASPYKRGFSRSGTVTNTQLNRGGTTIMGEVESPNRISSQVQITRSGTLAPKDLDDSQDMRRSVSPGRLEKMTTFNIDDSPSRSKLNHSVSSVSPHKHTHSHNPHNHENLSCLYYLDQANQSDQLKTQTDYLKKIIYNLQTKLDSMKEHEKNNDRLVVELSRADQKRKEMERLIREATDKSKQVRQEYNDTIDHILGEKQELQMALRNKQDSLNDAEAKIANLQFTIQQLQNQLVGFERKQIEYQSLNKHLKTQEQKIDDYDKKISDIVLNFEGKLKDLASLVDSLEKQKGLMQAEINKGLQTINQLKGDLNAQVFKQKELVHQNQSLERQIQVYKASEANIRALNEQVNLLHRDIQEITRQKNVAEKEISNLRKENGQLKNMLIEQEKSANDKAAGLRAKIIEQENKVAQAINEQDNLNKQNLGLRQEIKTFQLNACLSEDLMRQIDDEKHRADLLLKNSKESQQREKDLAQNVQNLNQNLLDARLQIGDLQNQLQETQQYCAQLKRLILEMKETGIAYIPYHNDPIDKALAEFINSMHDPSRLINLFMRESEGIYLFGTKKVYLKLEQDRILIRTGGGFMGIEEFLDVFAPPEVEKMRDNDPKKDFDKNQLVAKSIDSAKVVKQIKNQTSPLKNRSPQH